LVSNVAFKFNVLYCSYIPVLRKKPKSGAKNAKPITKTEQCESFFNFFYPPAVPEVG
jgi:nucleosome assembly protein 1-like 1